MDKIVELLESCALTEEEKAFNQSILYGKEVDFKSLYDTLRRFPMMSERQLVILKEAQSMRGLTELLSYIKNPSPQTVFVIVYKHKTIDKRTKFAKALLKTAVVLQSDRLYDNQLPDWATSYVSGKGYLLSPGASLLLSQYLGADLSRMANEIDKLCLLHEAGETIEEEQVRQQIGISKDFNVFELQKALVQGDKIQVFQIADHLSANPSKNPMVLILGSLFSFFHKVYAFKGNTGGQEGVQRILRTRSKFILREYEAAAKRYSFEDLEEILMLLAHYDLRSKGYENGQSTHGQLFHEFLLNIVDVGKVSNKLYTH